jgi:hypothetical protein
MVPEEDGRAFSTSLTLADHDFVLVNLERTI